MQKTFAWGGICPRPASSTTWNERGSLLAVLGTLRASMRALIFCATRLRSPGRVGGVPAQPASSTTQIPASHRHRERVVWNDVTLAVTKPTAELHILAPVCCGYDI